MNKIRKESGKAKVNKIRIRLCVLRDQNLALQHVADCKAAGM